MGEKAADYLIERGHKHVAFANFYFENPILGQRRDTFLARAKQRGLRASVAGEQFTVENVTEQARQIAEAISQTTPLPTGIFAATDERMLALFHALHRIGLEPGRDVDLIGCNNDPAYMSQMHPRPATVDIKLDAVGEQAVEQLLRRMAQPHAPNRTAILVQPVVAPSEETTDSDTIVGAELEKETMYELCV